MTELHEAGASADGAEPAQPPPADAVREPNRLLPARPGDAHRLTMIWPPALLGAVLVGVWYLVSYVILDERRRFLMPPPHAVVAEGFFGRTRRGEASSSVIFDALQRTGFIAAVGLAVAILLGVATAVLMSQSVQIERAVFPYMVMLQATPILALVPLIGFWFGYSTNPRVIVCVIIALFPIIVNTLFGLQSAERGMHDLFTLQHAGRLTRLRKLMFPAAMPAIFAGLRISAGLSVIGAIVGDFFFGQGTPGLGQVLKRATNNVESELLFATVIVACALGVVVFLFFGWLARLVTGRWHDTTAAP